LENEKVNFKFITNYTTKNYIEVNKVANKKAFLVVRLSFLILQIIISYNFINRCMNALDVNFIDGLIICLKDTGWQINVVLLVLLGWKIPELMTMYQIHMINKKESSKEIARTYTFYDTYYTMLSSAYSSQENNEDSAVIIRYSYVHRVYISKNLYIIKDYSGGISTLPKNSFIIGNEQDFLNFINNIFKNKINR
jgi:hypothetical protein